MTSSSLETLISDLEAKAGAFNTVGSLPPEEWDSVFDAWDKMEPGQKMLRLIAIIRRQREALTRQCFCRVGDDGEIYERCWICDALADVEKIAKGEP